MNLSFKSRIAFYYMLATAGVIAIVFFIVYIGVYSKVYQEVDNDLVFEANKHTKEVFTRHDSIYFINKTEWLEHEHREIQVNPVFIQVVNKAGKLMDKSPNLKEAFLAFHAQQEYGVEFNTTFNNQLIRQIQLPIQIEGEHKGYILTAMSLEGPIAVLKSLKWTLLILYPIILVGLFIITRFLAGRSIVPIQVITQTANQITRNNLNQRIPLPENQDELYSLTASINELLERIQNAMDREKQFTADASHQLRTPLSVLKGTLEVLIRKPRTEAEYKTKIQTSIVEIDRLSAIAEQLLTLSRFDNTHPPIHKDRWNIPIAVDRLLEHYKDKLLEKSLVIKIDAKEPNEVWTDPYYGDLILDNILSNAIKYSPQNAVITITIFPENEKLICQIEDEGIGIKKEDLEHIFYPFFRSDELAHKEIKGNGLGLSIAKKASNMIGVQLNVFSEIRKGTTFNIVFPQVAV